MVTIAIAMTGIIASACSKAGPRVSWGTVERSVTVALLFILFDGGLHIGWRRFRATASPIAISGVLGTFLTVGAAALLLHVGFGLVWFGALLVATAVAPTDPRDGVLRARQEGDRGTLLKLPMRVIEPEPWVLGVRLRHEPQGVGRFTVEEGASAVGRTVASLGQLGENFWINVLVRDRQAVSITGYTELEAGELLVQTDGATRDSLDGFFGTYRLGVVDPERQQSKRGSLHARRVLLTVSSSGL